MNIPVDAVSMDPGTWTMPKTMERLRNSATNLSARKPTIRVQIRCPGSDGANRALAEVISTSATISTATARAKRPFETAVPPAAPFTLHASIEASGARTRDATNNLLTDLDLILLLLSLQAVRSGLRHGPRPPIRATLPASDAWNRPGPEGAGDRSALPATSSARSNVSADLPR